MAGIKATQDEVIEALREKRGNVSRAAGSLRTSRSSLHKYINTRPKVAAALADIRESLLDDAEEMLENRMRDSDTLLIFFLKTRGAKRGYTETTHTELSGGLSASNVVVYIPDNGRGDAR